LYEEGIGPLKKRFSEDQIIGFLRDGEAGIAVKDLCRQHGFSVASYYLWKSKFGGMSVSDAKRLKELEKHGAQITTSIDRRSVWADCRRQSMRRGWLLVRHGKHREFQPRTLNRSATKIGITSVRGGTCR